MAMRKRKRVYEPVGSKRLMTGLEVARIHRKRAFDASRASLGASTGEVKWIDTVLTTTDISTTEIISALNLIPNGSDVSERVGREAVMISVQVTGHFFTNGASAGDDVFWAVVYDRQTNGALPTWQDVYTTDAVVPNIRTHYNRKRFKVLGSGYIVVPKVGADIRHVPFNFYRKLKHPVEYSSAAAIIDNVRSGSLIWMVRGTGAAGADDTSFSGSARVRFTDT